MTDTFNDRLLAVVIDEIRHPSIPHFEGEPEAPVPNRPNRPSRRSRRTLATVGAAAAVTMLIGGAAVVVNAPDSAPVRTTDVASQPASPAPAAAYLTFGDPVGTVYRGARGVDPGPMFTFRPVADSTVRIDVGRGMSVEGFRGLTEVAVVGDRHLRSLTLAESGGKPIGVDFWEEPDGSVWSVTVTSSATTSASSSATAEDPGSRSEAEPVRLAAVEDFLGQLVYADGAFTMGPGYEQFVPLDRAARNWTISDDRRTLSSIADSTTLISSIVGDTTTVRGHEAVFDGRSIFWRESTDEVIELSVMRADPNYDDGGPTSTVDEARVFAEAVVVSDRGAFDALPLHRGPNPERVVILPPPGEGSATFNTEEITVAGSGGAMAGPIGPDGVSLEISDGVTGLWVWSSSSGLAGSSRPACAQRVTVPSPGEPAVTIVLDPACTG